MEQSPRQTTLQAIKLKENIGENQYNAIFDHEFLNTTKIAKFMKE